MEIVYIVAIIGAVVVLCVLAWKFDVLKLSGGLGEGEGSLEASKREPGTTSANQRPATGGVSIGGKATDAKVRTNVIGAAEPGAGGVQIGGDAEGADVAARVTRGTDAD